MINPTAFQTFNPSVSIDGDVSIGTFQNLVRQKYGVFPIRVFDSRGKEYDDSESLRQASEWSYERRPIIMQVFEDSQIAREETVDIPLKFPSGNGFATITVPKSFTVGELKKAISEKFQILPTMTILSGSKVVPDGASAFEESMRAGPALIIIPILRSTPKSARY